MLLIDVELVNPRTGNKISKRLETKVVADTEQNRGLSCEAAVSEITIALRAMIERAGNGELD